MLTALLLLLLALYLFPTLLAAYLRVPGFWLILAVNLFLGWTIAGWAVALSWVMQRTGVVRSREDRALHGGDAAYFPRPPRR